MFLHAGKIDQSSLIESAYLHGFFSMFLIFMFQTIFTISNALEIVNFFKTLPNSATKKIAGRTDQRR